MICECGRIKERPRADGCNQCKAIDEARYRAEREEGTLTGKVKILLARHWPDWVDGAEIRDIINDRQSSTTLWDLRRAGEIEQRKGHGAGNEYRFKQRRVA